MDKTTGRSNKITITNDKGRLSKEEIEKMIAEAEKYKKEDEEAAERITSKNALESYSYNLRNSLADEKVGGKMDVADKEKLDAAVTETIKWLDAHHESHKDEYASQQKKLEEIANPIMTKLYQSTGGAPGAGGMPGMPGGMPSGGAPPSSGDAAGPTIEEVD